jgi:hypothetical protein
MLRRDHEHHIAKSDSAATLQYSYVVLAILYLLCISERILHLIDDITIILHVADTQLYTVIWVL